MYIDKSNKAHRFEGYLVDGRSGLRAFRNESDAKAYAAESELLRRLGGDANVLISPSEVLRRLAKDADTWDEASALLHDYTDGDPGAHWK